jgi:hypothetical protein
MLAPEIPVQNKKAVLSFGRGLYLDFDRCTYLLRSVQEGIARSEMEKVLGVSKPTVAVFIAFARGFDLLERKRCLTLTALGQLILKHDPFFQDSGTLWFLHYVVAAEARQLIWHQFASSFFPRHTSFTIQEARGYFSSLYDPSNQPSRKTNVYRETRLVLDAYLHKNFVCLGYLCLDGKRYALGERYPLPPEVLGASIARYRERYHAQDATAGIVELLTEPNGPGRIFQLSERTLRFMLEKIKNAGGMTLESRADLDQVRINPTITDITWMERYYASR